MSYYIARLNSKQAYTIVFFLYLIPGLPKDMISYAAGASEMRFKPFLPDCWNGYSYKFNYRGRIIELRVKPKGVTLTLISGEPISVTIYGHPYELEDVLTVPLEG